MTRFKEKCQSPASFCLFSSFQTNVTFFTTNMCEKCPLSIWCWESNPQHFRTWVSSHNHWTSAPAHWWPTFVRDIWPRMAESNFDFLKHYLVIYFDVLKNSEDCFYPFYGILQLLFGVKTCLSLSSVHGINFKEELVRWDVLFFKRLCRLRQKKGQKGL